MSCINQLYTTKYIIDLKVGFRIFKIHNEWAMQMQKKLAMDQISAFFHNQFVDQQVTHFLKMCNKYLNYNGLIVDVGGGCGFFAKALVDTVPVRVRVIDTDTNSIIEALRLGVEAEFGDALSPTCRGDEKIICFNLILHHIIGSSDKITEEFQMQAIGGWRETAEVIFVNEYIYESFFGDFSGWLIYQITKNKLLSFIANTISYIFPTLRANTFGVGVRFRNAHEWQQLFKNAGYKVVDQVRGDEEYISVPRRILLIKAIRRDSFLLEPI